MNDKSYWYLQDAYETNFSEWTVAVLHMRGNASLTISRHYLPYFQLLCKHTQQIPRS